jgi:flagellar protein FliL
MSNVEETAPKAVAGRTRRSLFRSWKMIAILILLIVAVGGGAGYWYFFLGVRTEADSAQVPEPDTPLPFYLEVKPFVVSTLNSLGTPHFVQLGPNLTLSGAAAGNAVSAVLPEVQDAMRQSVLTFKVDDIVTPAGIEKLREAMLTNINRVLLQRLGAERVKRLNGGGANSGVVQNLYFSTLIVE